MNHTVKSLHSFAATLAEGGRGVRVRRHARQPERLLEIYEMENCPFCRVVRQTLTELDLDALIYPCPKGGTRYRPLVRERGGRELFPYLNDPNTGRALYESADIVAYLYETYAGRDPPSHAAIKVPQTGGSLLASVVRSGNGTRAKTTGRLPAQPLELYSFETSPFSRLVRERLCEMEIPHVVRNCGRDQAAEWWVVPQVRQRVIPGYSPKQRNRRALMERTGWVQVPYLDDPNTDEAMYESADILRYIERTYG